MAASVVKSATATRSRRIVYVWDADYPWDVRVEKSCLALTAAGHDVHIVARNRKWSPTTERLREGTVHRMPPWRSVGQRVDGALGFPAFFSPRWRRLITSVVKEVAADLIIVRDLPLCPTAIHVGKRFGIPVILDMAENYPAMIRDIWTAKRHSIVDYAARNPRAVEAVERYCLTHVQHVITVVEESSARLAALGVPSDRLTVVSNTPSVERTHRTAVRGASPDQNTITVVYLGQLELHRGIGELIDAIALLRDRVAPVFRAQIIGDGRDAALFQQQAAALGLATDRVEFLGRLPYQEALAVVGRADIGIIPHHANESWNTTIPNKLFDYMSAGIPVLSSDARPCVRVLDETGAGLTFRSGDSADLAAALDRFSDPELRHAAATAGRAAVLSRYRWENDAARLALVVGA